jgi:hypothetical protein
MSAAPVMSTQVISAMAAADGPAGSRTDCMRIGQENRGPIP